MAEQLICLTIDTDPDGLNAPTPDRRSLVWDGLLFAFEHLPALLPDVPITWFARADGQLEAAEGSALWLFETQRAAWDALVARGDALGWHPHLYDSPLDEPRIMSPQAAVIELRRIASLLPALPYRLRAFRMGEAWQTAATLHTIEELGFSIDSTAIPGRDDRPAGHIRDWSGAPNAPYFPAVDDPRRAGAQRPLLEMPMNSWHFRAPYDSVPKLRYMNPCIHAALWDQALDAWESGLGEGELHIWTLIFHPAEAMPGPDDQLYAHDPAVLRRNLDVFAARIAARGDAPRFVTLETAADRWLEWMHP